jgi:IS30 family transposase
MPKQYHHLTYEQRCQIVAWKETRISQREIAQRLQISQSTVSREIRRNTSQGQYFPESAHKKATERRTRLRGKFPSLTKQHIDYVHKKMINDNWSLEQIAGRMEKDIRLKISHQTLYRSVKADRLAGGKLYFYLRRKGKRYRYRLGKEKQILVDRVDISKRPPVVDEKSRVGDWEVDSIVGAAHKGGLTTLVERKTRLVKIVKQERLKAESTKKGIIMALKPLKNSVLTLTSDNGTEFFHHQEIAKALEAEFYFAKPYSPWQRGCNENTNGLIRSFFPKGTCFDTVSDDDVKQVEDLLNHRPRKCLGYLTPFEAFQDLTGDALHLEI